MSTSFLFRQSLLDRLLSLKSCFRGWVLDLGCNDKPYQRLLGTSCDRWVGLDRPQYAGRRTRADVAADLAALCIRSDTFDVVLCTQALADVPWPSRVFAECHRVLKAGGYLVISEAQYDALHDEPNDYFRFTQYGLRALANEAGFSVVEALPVGGGAAVVGRVICGHLPPVNRSHWLSRVASALLQHIFYHVDRLFYRPRDTLGWVIACRKEPAGARKD